jgi:5-methyltetrahydrofolate--homocysteine methyltransferase
MLEKLGWKSPVLFDGALGTELLKAGLPPGKSTITLNVENPEIVLQVHRNYISAGCQAISANTFAGNLGALKSSGIEALEEEYNLQGMNIAQTAAGGKVKVAADIGPTGQFYRDFNHRQVKQIYIRQARLLELAYPDLFLIETMFDLREALAALEGVKALVKDTPVGVSMTFKKTPRGFFTIMGDLAIASLKALEKEGADFVGANCTIEPLEMLELLRTVRDAITIPLIMQPNAGQPEIIDGEIVYPMEPQRFAEGLVKLAETGAEIVGGCCGSTPEMIKLTKQRL